MSDQGCLLRISAKAKVNAYLVGDKIQWYFPFAKHFSAWRKRLISTATFFVYLILTGGSTKVTYRMNSEPAQTNCRNPSPSDSFSSFMQIDSRPMKQKSGYCNADGRKRRRRQRQQGDFLQRPKRQSGNGSGKRRLLLLLVGERSQWKKSHHPHPISRPDVDAAR